MIIIIYNLLSYIILLLYIYFTFIFLCPNSLTLGTNSEIQIYLPIPPTLPTKLLSLHSYPYGLHNEPSL